MRRREFIRRLAIGVAASGMLLDFVVRQRPKLEQELSEETLAMAVRDFTDQGYSLRPHTLIVEPRYLHIAQRLLLERKS